MMKNPFFFFNDCLFCCLKSWKIALTTTLQSSWLQRKEIWHNQPLISFFLPNHVSFYFSLDGLQWPKRTWNTQTLDTFQSGLWHLVNFSQTQVHPTSVFFLWQIFTTWQSKKSLANAWVIHRIWKNYHNMMTWMSEVTILSTNDPNHVPPTLTNPLIGCKKCDLQWVSIITLLPQMWLPLLTLMKAQRQDLLSDWHKKFQFMSR